MFHLRSTVGFWNPNTQLIKVKWAKYTFCKIVLDFNRTQISPILIFVQLYFLKMLAHLSVHTVQCKLTVNSSFTVFEFFNKKWALFSYCNISITSFIYTVR